MMRLAAQQLARFSAPLRTSVRLGGVLVVLFAGLWAVDTWLLNGLLVPRIVASSSMAPALAGPRRHWQCAQCGNEFERELERLPVIRAELACPHCRAANELSAGIDLPGDRVLVDRLSLMYRSPRRGEIVVFHLPGEADQLGVKRVVGLPGERVRIRDGQVWIDGRVVPHDVQYAPDHAGREMREYQLSADEYFLLGDNSACSEDSRHWWPHRRVLKCQIQGRALRW